MKAQNSYTPSERAARYLKRIVALTGAKQVHGKSYMIAVARKHFLVNSKFVHLLAGRGKSTCFSLAGDLDTPSVEIVASVLLQLKSNPKLFKKWRKRPGCAFKASGKLFRGT
jgi:hypothetical protein